MNADVQRDCGYWLVDGLDGPPWDNTLHCSCGTRLWPDCDVSAASIVAEFERHLSDDHGIVFIARQP